MKTNLIIAEGLPGSGKSTTAAMIAQELERNGVKTVCVDEGVPDHPADYADYDFPDFVTEREKILEKWRSFVKTADRETVYVFNCIFLQNPMCETMMRFGMDEKASEQYIGEIAEIRTRLHKHMRTSFRQILPQTALKILAGRKPACGFLPTLQQNYARKSAHISYEDRF